MPTRFLEDGATPVVQFDPQLEVSPFAVFRALREGRGPLLVDVRPEPGALTLAGALLYPGPDWTPPADADVVLFDDDGAIAIEGARHMQAAGYPKVKALFGGLDLWEFSLDPEVVGADTYLVRLAPHG
ncbi:MAG: Rhodanese-like domain [Acidobacteriota bacterium]|jgi:rhodanese-related sulfurtransferase|nr:Rhodanese-like domain [Acidobacteriota bacterium]